MIVSTTIRVAPAADLPGINGLLAAGEAANGPLSGMGNDGTSTTLTFSTGNPPNPATTISENLNGLPPAGRTAKLSGAIFVKGTLTLCFAI